MITGRFWLRSSRGKVRRNHHNFRSDFAAGCQSPATARKRDVQGEYFPPPPAGPVRPQCLAAILWAEKSADDRNLRRTSRSFEICFRCRQGVNCISEPFE